MKHIQQKNAKNMAKLALSLTKQQNDKKVEEAIERTKEEFGHIAIRAITAASMVALHDQFMFGPKRLEKYQKAVEEHLECITWGVITLEELEALTNNLEERATINLQDETDFIKANRDKLRK